MLFETMAGTVKRQHTIALEERFLQGAQLANRTMDRQIAQSQKLTQASEAYHTAPKHEKAKAEARLRAAIAEMEAVGQQAKALHAKANRMMSHPETAPKAKALAPEVIALSTATSDGAATFCVNDPLPAIEISATRTGPLLTQKSIQPVQSLDDKSTGVAGAEPTKPAKTLPSDGEICIPTEAASTSPPITIVSKKAPDLQTAPPKTPDVAVT